MQQLLAICLTCRQDSSNPDPSSISDVGLLQLGFTMAQCRLECALSITKTARLIFSEGCKVTRPRVPVSLKQETKSLGALLNLRIVVTRNLRANRLRTHLEHHQQHGQL